MLEVPPAALARVRAEWFGNVRGDLVAGIIPMAALVAVMFMVALDTFDWRSLPGMLRYPESETIAMVATVGTVLLTHDLAIGVGVGVVSSAIFFSRTIAKSTQVTSALDASGRTRTYTVAGQVFFVATEAFAAAFDTAEDLDTVVLDLRHAQLWDAGAVAALDKVVLRFRANGTRVELQNVDAKGAELLAKLAVFDRPGARLDAH